MVSPKSFFIIEGSWQSAQQYNASPPRSGIETYNIIDKHVDNKRVFLVQANEARERNQRQIGLELAKEHGADWFWMLDSDEIYTRSNLQAMAAMLTRAPKKSMRWVSASQLQFHQQLQSLVRWKLLADLQADTEGRVLHGQRCQLRERQAAVGSNDLDHA
jgi:hypothetical protein